MLVPLVLYFLRPCVSLANYFEQPLIQSFPYDTFINCLYSSIFAVVMSSTAFILIRVVIDGSEALLISCWTGCYNVSGRFIIVKAALVLSIKEVLG